MPNQEERKEVIVRFKIRPGHNNAISDLTIDRQDGNGPQKPNEPKDYSLSDDQTSVLCISESKRKRKGCKNYPVCIYHGGKVYCLS